MYLLLKQNYSLDEENEHLKKENGFIVEYEKNNNLSVLKHKQQQVYVIGTLLDSIDQNLNFNKINQKKIGHFANNANGSFSIIIPNNDKVTVITDAAGSIPVYYGYGPNGFALGYPVNKVAKATDLTEVDEVSVVDLLINGNVCYPYSWYKNVFMVPPASVVTYSVNGVIETHNYWFPEEKSDIMEKDCDINTWAAQLHSVVKKNIESSIEEGEKVRVFFSGGEDSRAVLGMMPKDINCIPTIVLEKKNREYILAKRAAKLMGYKLDWIKRPKRYYHNNILERVNEVGPGFDINSAHMFGSIADKIKDADKTFGGISSDSFFKTLYMGNINKGKRGWKDKIETPNTNLIPALKNFHKLHNFFKDNLIEELKNRRYSHHEFLKKYRPLTAGNWHTFFPTSMRLDYTHYLNCLQIGPKVIEPFTFSSSFRLAASMPDPCRIDRKVFYKAFTKEMGLSGWVPTSGGKIPKANNKWIDYSYRVFLRNRRKVWTHNYEKGYQGAWSTNRLTMDNIRFDKILDEKELVHFSNIMGKILKNDDVNKYLKNSEIITNNNLMTTMNLSCGFRIS